VARLAPGTVELHPAGRAGGARRAGRAAQVIAQEELRWVGSLAQGHPRRPGIVVFGAVPGLPLEVVADEDGGYPAKDFQFLRFRRPSVGVQPERQPPAVDRAEGRAMVWPPSAHLFSPVNGLKCEKLGFNY